MDGIIHIRPQSPLPELTALLTIDGSVQPSADTGEAGIQIDGDLLTGGAYGLKLAAPSATIRGVNVHGFPGHGILADDRSLELINCDISANGGDGIRARDLQLTTTPFFQRHLIESNAGDGLRITGTLRADRYGIRGNHGWGIRHTGDEISVNDSERIVVGIENNQLGGIVSEAVFFSGSKLRVADNGAQSQDSSTGQGLRLPNADTDLINVDITGNRRDGIICLGGKWEGSPMEILNNQENGARINGDLVTEEVRIEGNSGWGLIASGQRLDLNENGNEQTSIKRNRRGGLFFSGSRLDMGVAHVDSNGDPLSTRPGGGHGVFAPNAEICVLNLKARENQGDGVICRKLEWDGNNGLIQANQGNGLVVYGDAIVNHRIRILDNRGWGAIVRGPSLLINPDQGNGTSSVDNNRAGGIQFLGAQFEAHGISVMGNGTDSPDAGGIHAPNSEVELTQLKAIGNHGVGLAARTLDLDQGSVSGNTGDGVVVCPGPAVVEFVKLKGNTGSGLKICAGSTGMSSTLDFLNVIENGENGVCMESTDPLIVEDCRFRGNAGFALKNSSTATDNVDAEDNYWGDASGPGGAGPGQGDAVSSNIDFEPWNTSSGGLTLAPRRTAYRSSAGKTVTVSTIVRQGEATQDLQLTATDSLNWLTTDSPIFVAMEDGIASLNIDLEAPAVVAPGTKTTVMLGVSVISSANTGQSAMTMVDVEIYEPALSEIRVRPETIVISPGRVVTFTTEGVDQHGRPIPFDPKVTAVSGGSLDDSGRFIAGSEPGPIVVDFSNTSESVTTRVNGTIVGDRERPRLELVTDIPIKEVLAVTLPRNRANLVIEISSDMINWKPVRTFPSSPMTEFHFEPFEGDRKFVRVREQTSD